MKPYNRDNSKKSEEIEEMFDNIAPTYDMLNHTLSFNIDKLWRARLIRIIKAHKPRRILDVATGTGDVAIALAKKIEGVEVVGVDLSEGMLSYAKQKSEAANLDSIISFEQSKAEELKFEDGSFDVATAAFGVRNFESAQGGVAQMSRCVRSGGMVVILEFSTPKRSIFAWGYKFYSYKILPLIASIFAKGHRSAYDYLPASVDEFYSPDEFLTLMQSVGLKECRKESLTFGVAHIYMGIKGEL
ncbi:MAG: bifunctional demethylmenaquinone methyltransferase/2-methoxy-6-polyprenyl-1,4-benzoquinol methylase UbiE [Rikenellaceae bacterium]